MRSDPPSEEAKKSCDKKALVRFMEKTSVIQTLISFSLIFSPLAVEPKGYRLLSITETSKLILISEIPSKTKYLLDASAAKITVDGKPAEFKDLKAYTLIHVKFEVSKGSKDGVEIHGAASEIKILSPENPK